MVRYLLSAFEPTGTVFRQTVEFSQAIFSPLAISGFAMISLSAASLAGYSRVS